MANSLTFGNPLKFGQDSCHTTKGRQIPSSNERESTRSSAGNTLSVPTNQEGPSTGPAHAGALPRQVVERRPDDGGFPIRSRPSVDRLAASLGIDESLAFRSLDIGFQKHENWHWPLGLSFWKRLLLYPNRLSSKEQKCFPKRGVRYFHGALKLFSHALPLSSHALLLSSHANIG